MSQLQLKVMFILLWAKLLEITLIVIVLPGFTPCSGARFTKYLTIYL